MVNVFIPNTEVMKTFGTNRPKFNLADIR